MRPDHLPIEEERALHAFTHPPHPTQTHSTHRHNMADDNAAALAAAPAEEAEEESIHISHLKRAIEKAQDAKAAGRS